MDEQLREIQLRVDPVSAAGRGQAGQDGGRAGVHHVEDTRAELGMRVLIWSIHTRSGLGLNPLLQSKPMVS